MAFTNTEIQEILNAIKAQSTDLKSMPAVADIDGVKSLPGVRNGSLVLVPLAILQEPAVSAAEEARTATADANSAVVRVNEALKGLTGGYQVTGDFARFSLILSGDITPEAASYAGNDYSVVFLEDKNVFAARVRDSSVALSGMEHIVAGRTRYYKNWPTADMYMDSSRTVPLADRLFMNDGVLYYWSGTSLETAKVLGAGNTSRIEVLSQSEFENLESKKKDTIYFVTSQS